MRIQDSEALPLHEVCRVADVAPGTMIPVNVDGVALVLVRDPTGEFHALRDVCPHRQAPLSAGVLFPLMEADDVGEYSESSASFVIRCPYHGYEFATETGLCPADPARTRVRTYPVHVKDATVFVERGS